MTGPIQGPLLSYETFTAFCLEAELFRHPDVRPAARATVVLSVLDRDGGAGHDAFGVLDHGQQQLDAGSVRLRRCKTAQFVPDDWARIIFSPVVWVRFPHMLLAAYLTGAFCVAATGAWYLLRRIYHAEARIMLRMGLFLAAVLVPVQLIFGHLVGDYVHSTSPQSSPRSRHAGTTSSRPPRC